MEAAEASQQQALLTEANKLQSIRLAALRGPNGSQGSVGADTCGAREGTGGAVKLSALKSGQGWALLDGGATHCMRNARRAESEAALPCLVHLASGEAELRIKTADP